jgi:sulfoxide reductase heme-binding subunit YedZ
MRDSARYAPLGAAALLSALVAAWAYGVLVDPESQVRFAVRETAYVSATFFLCAYLARPLQRLAASPLATYLVRARRQFGLAAALAHTVHFGFVVALFVTVATTANWITVVFGGFGFVVYWAMAATSNDAAVRALGSNWKRLHRFGIHYLWFIYFVTFLGAVARRPIDWLFVAVFVNALGMRTYLWSRRRAIVGETAA